MMKTGQKTSSPAATGASTHPASLPAGLHSMVLPALLAVHALGSSLAAPLAAAVPPTMQAVRTTGGCNAPFTCVKVVSVPTPKPRRGEALIKIQA
eukprot:COSAG04_NODE_22073_length_361_cov_2.763359_1_plen_94_part_10